VLQQCCSRMQQLQQQQQLCGLQLLVLSIQMQLETYENIAIGHFWT
jgi:hypothetical protein